MCHLGKQLSRVRSVTSFQNDLRGRVPARVNLVNLLEGRGKSDGCGMGKMERLRQFC